MCSESLEEYVTAATSKRTRTTTYMQHGAGANKRKTEDGTKKKKTGTYLPGKGKRNYGSSPITLSGFTIDSLTHSLSSLEKYPISQTRHPGSNTLDTTEEKKKKKKTNNRK